MVSVKPTPAYWDCKIGTANPAPGLTCYYKDGCVQKPSVCPSLGYSNTHSQGCVTVWLDYAGFACFDSNWKGLIRRYWKNDWYCWSGLWPVDSAGNISPAGWCNGNQGHFKIVQGAKLECCRNGSLSDYCFTTCEDKTGYGHSETCYATQAECETAKKALPKNPYWGGFAIECNLNTRCDVW